MRRYRGFAGAVVVILLVGCGAPGWVGSTLQRTDVSAATATPAGPPSSTAQPAPTDEPASSEPRPSATSVVLPSPTSPPAQSAGLTPTELKYRLFASFGDVFFCDPDQFPVGVSEQVELERALTQFQSIRGNPEEFGAILRQNGLAAGAELSDAQKLLVYREHKRLSAILLERSGADHRFSLRVSEADQGFAVEGLIDAAGDITITSKAPGFNTCPICLPGGTQIDTPHGLVSVEDLQPGMQVWSVDRAGERRATVLVETVQRATVPNQQMVRLILDDGRQLLASAGHPTADGRTIGALATGDSVDGARVVDRALVPQAEPYTYDILPAGDTGLYWANGVLVGSTLAPPAAAAREPQPPTQARLPERA